jgi:phage-related minor tail protein
MANNLYQDLKDALEQFKTFLDANVPIIKPAIAALATAVPQITELLNRLITLMGQLKTEIQNLNVAGIPALGQVAQFTEGVRTLLTTAQNLLPAQRPAIDEVLAVVNVVSGLPTLDTVKADIIALIDHITGKLNELKA